MVYSRSLGFRILGFRCESAMEANSLTSSVGQVHGAVTLQTYSEQKICKQGRSA